MPRSSSQPYGLPLGAACTAAADRLTSLKLTVAYTAVHDVKHPTYSHTCEVLHEGAEFHRQRGTRYVWYIPHVYTPLLKEAERRLLHPNKFLWFNVKTTSSPAPPHSLPSTPADDDGNNGGVDMIGFPAGGALHTTAVLIVL